MENIRVVELFAGVGGFRLGLEQASSCFQTVWANQWEPSMRSQFAFECYERHFGHRTEHVCQDIVTAKGNIPPQDRKSTRLNSSHRSQSRMPSSA